MARHHTAITIMIPIGMATATVIGIGIGTVVVIAAHRHIIRMEFQGECRGALPRRSRRPHKTRTEARGFPCRPVRDARSAEWELMTPLSLTRSVREHGFQMHHYQQQTTGPA